MKFKLLFALLPIFGTLPSWAQPAEVRQPMITMHVDDTQIQRLNGTVHPLARPEFDAGLAPRTLPMERMTLVLKRTVQQEAALDDLLTHQLDRNSPLYHKWLTPEQFGQRFGPSDADIQTINSWLQSHGFQIETVTKGRTVIVFSGQAANVSEAFHTDIHRFVVNGETHWANSTELHIPVALTSAVAGVASLNSFHSKPQLKISGHQLSAKVKPHVSQPEYSVYGTHALSPTDFATIYNTQPLLQAGINGTGTTIAVLGRSNFNVQDVVDFRNVFGLVPNAPQIVLNGADPGNLGGAEEDEAVLDVSWAGAVAPNATVNFILSASTNSADGVDLSEIYVVDNAGANVVTESFGYCEAYSNPGDIQEKQFLAQQMAAQGMTYIVSTGDSGSAGCDAPNSKAATGSLAVNLLASTPYTVAVGGTQLNASNAYWSTSNGQAYAQSYIPENVWNESCDVTTCGNSAELYASGGGASSLFAKPTWQTGVAGIPNDGYRDVPDVALSAAVGVDPYLLCLHGSCQASSSGQISFMEIGGTSAAAPTFAGIIALVNQKTNSLQGNANPTLYALAALQSSEACNASNTSVLPASSCIFNDVTSGQNSVPGESGYNTPDGTYRAGVGFDLATGLGSVNAANLVNSWQTAALSTTTLYEIANRNSGLALDVSYGSTKHGAGIIQWTFWNSLDQKWKLVAAQPPYFAILNAKSGLSLDTYYGGTSDGTKMLQWDYWGGDEQLWQLIPVNGAYYEIVNKKSGRVLDMSNASTSPGAQLQIWDYLGGSNQQWQLIPAQ